MDETSADWPTDCQDILNRILSTTDLAERREGLRHFAPCIQKVALATFAWKRSRGGWRRLDPDEFLSESYLKMVALLMDPARDHVGFDPTKGVTWKTWLSTILRNKGSDLLRTSPRDVQDPVIPDGSSAAGKHLTEAAVDQRTDHTAARLDAVLDNRRPLSAADLRKIDSWQPRDRILVLCLSGWYRQVLRHAPGRWQRWVA